MSISYGSAKFQPNPLFSSQQMATESVAAEQKKKQKERKKVGKPIGDPVRGRDAPIISPLVILSMEKTMVAKLTSSD